MRDAGLMGASHRRGGPTTTQRDKEVRPAPDLVDRNFTASGPNQLWIADITYLPTAAGFLYLAVVLDVWSRKPDAERPSEVVGWSMANHLRAELVLDALEMAVGQQRPKDVVHHSDQGFHEPDFSPRWTPWGAQAIAPGYPRQACRRRLGHVSRTDGDHSCKSRRPPNDMYCG